MSTLFHSIKISLIPCFLASCDHLHTFKSPPSNFHPLKSHLFQRWRSFNQPQCTNRRKEPQRRVLCVSNHSVFHSLGIGEFNLLSLLRTSPLLTTIFVWLFAEIKVCVVILFVYWNLVPSKAKRLNRLLRWIWLYCTYPISATYLATVIVLWFNYVVEA